VRNKSAATNSTPALCWHAKKKATVLRELSASEAQKLKTRMETQCTWMNEKTTQHSLVEV